MEILRTPLEDQMELKIDLRNRYISLLNSLYEEQNFIIDAPVIGFEDNLHKVGETIYKVKNKIQDLNKELTNSL